MKKGIRIGLAVLMIVSVIALALTGCAKEEAPVTPAAPEVIEWKFTAYVPSAMATFGYDEWTCKTIGELSGGRLVVEAFPAGAIVGAMEAFDAVKDGAVEMAHTCPNYQEGVELCLSLFGVWPFGLDIDEFMMWMEFGGGKEMMQEVYGKYNIMPLMADVAPQELGGFSNFPVNSYDDLKGKTYRLTGPGAEVLAKLGVKPVKVSGAEVYSALETGVLDVGEWSGPYDTWPMKFHEVAPYIFMPGFHQPCTQTIFMISMDAWNELPDDLKSVVEVACMASSHRHTWLAEYNNGIYLQKYVDYGCTFTRIPQEEVDALAPLVLELKEEYAAKDPLFKEIYAKQKAWVESYREYHAWSHLITKYVAEYQ